jgi:hypothetical protein
MFNFNDFHVKQEQHRDFLREAAKERLIRSVQGRPERPNLLAGIREFVAEKIEDGKYSSWMMKFRNAH